jgi:hypothetical protein
MKKRKPRPVAKERPERKRQAAIRIEDIEVNGGFDQETGEKLVSLSFMCADKNSFPVSFNLDLARSLSEILQVCIAFLEVPRN